MVIPFEIYIIMNFVLPCLEIIVAVIKRSTVFVFFLSLSFCFIQIGIVPHIGLVENM